jgi:hypothetical protein
VSPPVPTCPPLGPPPPRTSGRPRRSPSACTRAPAASGESTTRAVAWPRRC